MFLFDASKEQNESGVENIKKMSKKAFVSFSKLMFVGSFEAQLLYYYERLFIMLPRPLCSPPVVQILHFILLCFSFMEFFPPKLA